MSGLAPLARPLAVLAAFAVTGVLCGVLWEWVWSPPTGVVLRGQWLLEPPGPDFAFSATGWYVVVAALAGGLLAAAIGWAFPGRELTTVAAVLVGSVIAAWLMSSVGHALGPADPRVLAQGREDLTQLPADLRASGSALAAFPTGAMLGLAGVYLSGHGRLGPGRHVRD